MVKLFKVTHLLFIAAYTIAFSIVSQQHLVCPPPAGRMIGIGTPGGRVRFEGGCDLLHFQPGWLINDAEGLNSL